MARRSKYSHASATFKTKRAGTKKRKLIIAICAIAIFAIAICVGIVSYHRIIDSRLISLSDSEKSMLKNSTDNVSYTILKTDIGVSSSAPESYNTSSNVIKYSLLRCDFSNNQVSILSIPNNLALQNQNDETKALLSLDEEEGISGIVSSLSKFVGVDINHFVSIDDTIIKKIVDDIGGVEIDVPHTIDDPNSGCNVMEAKKSNLSSDQALQALRAMNVANYSETHKTIVESFFKSVLDKIKNSDNFDVASKISDVSSKIKTELLYLLNLTKQKM